MPRNDRIKLLVTIVDRGKGSAAVDIYRSHQLHFDYLCMGLGTANSQILDYFGLSETEKDVVFTLAPAWKVKNIIQKIDERFHLTRPGRGIVFSLPLTGVSGQVPQVLCKDEAPQEEEEETVEAVTKYDLILVVVNRDSLDTVMDAAREKGARGGTVLHARRVGLEDVENLLGFTLQPEKEIVAILSPRTQKLEIMRAINKVAGLTTECQGILFSLPVEDMMGLQDAIRE
ncbi:MAG TPA: transcriptional regulator [Candidatus Merdivicinus faecavium]|nr:transcriptional regulator [Candidatus Merdivicinus faecavium]